MTVGTAPPPVAYRTSGKTSLTAGRRRRVHWRANGELHPCAACLEPVFYHRRTGRWLDDDGREHTHPPLSTAWRWFALEAPSDGFDGAAA